MAKNMQYWKDKFTQSEASSPFTFNEDAVNQARKKRISKRMADRDVSMDKWRRNLDRYRKDKEKGRY